MPGRDHDVFGVTSPLVLTEQVHAAVRRLHLQQSRQLPAGRRDQLDRVAHTTLLGNGNRAVIELEDGWACDAGAPGPRQGAMTPYYGAFVFDPDGNKIEAVTFPA